MFSINHPPKYTRPNQKRIQKAKRKRKAKTFGKALLAAWIDFCTTSSFVGFRYIYRKNRTLFDILFWVLLMIALMYGSITFVSDFLERYHSMSTTAIIQSQQFLISRSVFPGVTACLSSRISKSRVHDFIDKYINSDEDLRQNVNITHFVKIFHLNKNPSSITLSNVGRVFSTYNLTMRDMLYMTTEDCEQILTVCRWAGKPIPCNHIFRKTLAVGGYCCSFNYPIKKEIRRNWLRTATYGLNGGLTFAFKTIPHEDYLFKVSYGNTLRVLIHSPASVPVFNENDVLIQKSMETYIEINNVYNTADSKVRNLPIEDRDCVFSFEKELSHFDRYSYSNCLLQCIIDRTIRNCGCVSYYVPSNDGDVCGTDQYLCSYNSRRVGAKHGEKQILTQVGDCDCPDDCVIVKQNSKITSWDFTTNNNYSVDDFYSKVTNDEGIVHISFSKSTTQRLNKKLSFDEVELASNIGGIVSLFLGCSFVSVIEIIYFLTIRMLKFYNSEI